MSATTSEHVGQVPLLDDSLSYHDTSETTQDFKYYLNSFNKSEQSRKLQKASTLSEYMMHLTSLPDYDMIKPVSLEDELELFTNLKTEIKPTRVLYDCSGYAQTFLINGVEAIRNIRGFESLMEKSLSDISQAGTGPGHAVGSSTRIAGEMELDTGYAESSLRAHTRHHQVSGALEDTSSDLDEDSDSSSSSSSKTSDRSSSSESDVETARAPTRDLSANIQHVYHGSPLRASLSIEWPASGPSVVYNTGDHWSESPSSTLSSLSPSPPPIHGSSSKRRSPELGRAAQKRVRLSPDSDYRSETSSDGEYEPEEGSSKTRKSRTKRSTRRPKASSSRITESSDNRFYCCHKDCSTRNFGFKTNKDRNRHMDSHWGSRFRCFTCDTPFPRHDALKRHCDSIAACLGPIPPPKDPVWPQVMWETRLNELVKPPPGDPLRAQLWRD